MAKIISALICDKRVLSSETFIIELEAPELAAAAAPGNFVMVSPMREGVNYDPITPRPYSIFSRSFDTAGKPAGFSLIIKRFGRGSDAIFEREIGQTLQINGPLGNALELEENSRYAMTAGGTGIAPVTFAAQEMNRRSIDYKVFYGGKDKNAVFLEELARAGIEAEAATEDGSLGHRGLVTELLARKLDATDVVFACGPWNMMRASAEVARQAGLPCMCSLERYMACGFGVCLACIYKKNSDDVWHTCCKEGPVVDGAEVDWDA